MTRLLKLELGLAIQVTVINMGSYTSHVSRTSEGMCNPYPDLQILNLPQSTLEGGRSVFHPVIITR